MSPEMKNLLNGQAEKINEIARLLADLAKNATQIQKAVAQPDPASTMLQAVRNALNGGAPAVYSPAGPKKRKPSSNRRSWTKKDGEPMQQKLNRMVPAILSTQTDPVTTAKLLIELRRQGIKFSGSSPTNNLAGRLSQMRKRGLVVNVAGEGWKASNPSPTS